MSKYQLKGSDPFKFSTTTVESNENNIEPVSAYLTNQKNSVNSIFHEEISDERENLNILTIITQSEQPHIKTQSPALSVNIETALNAIKVDLPNYDFGEPITTQANSFRWENKSQQWSATTF